MTTKLETLKMDKQAHHTIKNLNGYETYQASEVGKCRLMQFDHTFLLLSHWKY